MILAASFYPLCMGAIMLLAYLKNGGIDAADYPSYVIPYTPICVALLITIALLPLVFKWGKRFALPMLSALGVPLFLGVEVGFEQIAVFSDVSQKMSIETWQMLSCVATPQVKDAIWDSLNIRYNPLFKMHFYAIALVIVLVCIGVVYGFYQMAHTKSFSKKKPLVVQLFAVIIFIGLCILACLTAFFRTGDINVSPLSAMLMTLFFLTFGMTAGVYAGTWLYQKRRLFSVAIPSVMAMLFTFLMYIAEMVMMNGALFRFGNGFLFQRLGILPLSAVDIMTVITSGLVTYFILKAIRPKDA